VQLVPRRLDLVEVGCVDHVDDGVDAPAVPLPHRSEPRLAANVPQLYSHVAFRDLEILKFDIRFKIQ
jgi:hypothetical protein